MLTVNVGVKMEFDMRETTRVRNRVSVRLRVRVRVRDSVRLRVRVRVRDSVRLRVSVSCGVGVSVSDRRARQVFEVKQNSLSK
jgi:hypothetical protein